MSRAMGWGGGFCRPCDSGSDSAGTEPRRERPRLGRAFPAPRPGEGVVHVSVPGVHVPRKVGRHLSANSRDRAACTRANCRRCSTRFLARYTPRTMESVLAEFGPVGRHRCVILTRCSAVSRASRPPVGGFAALDASCAPRRSAIIDGVGVDRRTNTPNAEPRGLSRSQLGREFDDPPSPRPASQLWSDGEI